MEIANEDWARYRELVLLEIRRLNDETHLFRSSLHSFRNDMASHMSSIHLEMTTMKVEIGKLQVKSGIWGAVAGIVMSMGFWIAAKFAH